jgi:predicted transcriptional regulator
MNTVELDERTARELAEWAQAQEVDLSALASEAIRAYLRAQAQRVMDQEAAAFRKLHPQLLETIPDEYAAIHRGELVDHDPDLVTLYKRISQRFGSLPVLMRQVKPEPEQVFVIRSPRIEYE